MIQLSPHPELHPVFESLGYFIGFAVYRRARQKSGDILDDQQRWSIIAATTVGALLGSRLLGLLEQAPRVHLSLSQLLAPSGGKTIVGGLLGGWLSVELVKKFKGIHTRTGDLFAIPLCVGIGVGRIGCLLAGISDDTYGTPTSLPWGVNFGDGMFRHPTQAYEILFVSALALILQFLERRPHQNGSLFRFFMAAYLTWRLIVDFLKPEPLLCGLNLIQWACMAGLVMLITDRKVEDQNVWVPTEAEPDGQSLDDLGYRYGRWFWNLRSKHAGNGWPWCIWRSRLHRCRSFLCIPGQPGGNRLGFHCQQCP